MRAYPDISPSDSSEYKFSENEKANMNLGGLSSDRFANIQRIYTSPLNATEIYTATRYGKRYILKGISADFRNDPIKNIALKKEFDIGISLDHPNIRQTIGYENVDGLGKVIVLEFFDGNTLENYLKTKSLSIATARSVATQIASAMQYIHSKQILHRDMKPANILVSYQWAYVKLIDFNLSDSDSFVIFKNPAGSEKYMAPELKDGSAGTSQLTDIYSFGMIIKDLAEASGDSALMDIARRCTDPSPGKRPRAIDEIALPSPGRFAITLSRILFSKATTGLLCGIIIILLALIFYLVK